MCHINSFYLIKYDEHTPPNPKLVSCYCVTCGRITHPSAEPLGIWHPAEWEMVTESLWHFIPFLLPHFHDTSAVVLQWLIPSNDVAVIPVCSFISQCVYLGYSRFALTEPIVYTDALITHLQCYFASRWELAGRVCVCSRNQVSGRNKHLLPMTCNVKARWACWQLALVMPVVLQREADCTVKGDHVYPWATGHLMVSSGILLRFFIHPFFFLCFSCIKAL